MSCCVYCDKEYGVGGYHIGVPVILGAGGIERVVEVKLDKIEQAAFNESLGQVKELSAKVDGFLS